MRLGTKNVGQHQSSVELVDLAAEATVYMKFVGAELGRREPDEAAALRLVQHYDEGRVAPYLAAYLFGEIGHPAGYDCTREILLAAPGQLAESYAGVALAKMRGADSQPDLIALMMDAEERKARDGAAWGLAHLPLTAVTAAATFDAGIHRRISYRTAAAVLCRTETLSDAVQAALVRLFTEERPEHDERRLRIFTDTFWHALIDEASRKAMSPLLRQLTPQLVSVLETSSVSMSSRKRADFETWVREKGLLSEARTAS